MCSEYERVRYVPIGIPKRAHARSETRETRSAGVACVSRNPRRRRSFDSRFPVVFIDNRRRTSHAAAGKTRGPTFNRSQDPVPAWKPKTTHDLRPSDTTPFLLRRDAASWLPTGTGDRRPRPSIGAYRGRQRERVRRERRRGPSPWVYDVTGDAATKTHPLARVRRAHGPRSDAIRLYTRGPRFDVI